MVRRRLKELMQRYAEVAGEPLLPKRLALTTGLTTSTGHQLVEGDPKRVSFKTGDVRLNFFGEKLGPLPTDDLLQFVCPAGRPCFPKRFKRLPVTPSAGTYAGPCCAPKKRGRLQEQVAIFRLLVCSSGCKRAA